MCKHPQLLSVRLSVLPALSLVLLADASKLELTFHRTMMQDPSENVFLRWCSCKENLPSIFAGREQLLLCFCVFRGGFLVLPPFLTQFAWGSPAWHGGSVTILLCFHSSWAAFLLPAAEIVLAGA